ncbi:hypothetical protein BJ170DRAFT_626627 [Xylariales sp. AK1849]|nr:hypothetical protein BJ170DRAFT_626627 [Xylariales sp. AK1849]
MAAPEEGTVQLLLMSNTPLSHIQTSASIRRVERLNQSVALFRLTKGCRVAIEANRATSDIVLGRDAADSPAPPEFSIWYPLFGATYLVSMSPAGIAATCNNVTSLLICNQRVDLTSDIIVPFPCAGNEPSPGAFVVCPRSPSEALATMGLWHDLPVMWSPRDPVLSEVADSQEDESESSADTEMGGNSVASRRRRAAAERRRSVETNSESELESLAAADDEDSDFGGGLRRNTESLSRSRGNMRGQSWGVKLSCRGDVEILPLRGMTKSGPRSRTATEKRHIASKRSSGRR